jgi:dihydrofolate reductase
MRKIIVSEFITLDGVVQAPGGADEDLDGGFAHGGWVPPLWDDGVGAVFSAAMSNVDTLLLGRRTYVGHAQAFEPNPAEDPFGTVRKYVVSKTLTESMWRDSTIIRDNVIESIRALKAQPGKDILTDGSSQLVQAMLANDLIDELRLYTFPVIVGGGKRIFPNGIKATFALVSSKPLQNGIVILHYARKG